MPNIIDVHVGNRLRVIRRLNNVSQKELSDKIGVHSQQIQKYERAINRISASRLYEICNYFNVSADFFFSDFGCKKGGVVGNDGSDIFGEESVAILQMYYSMSHERRAVFLNLVKSLGSESFK